tara:strand:+ start:273 stop:449 length:177 start_codon:yes stop_codon:yes gene_type:complete
LKEQGREHAKSFNIRQEAEQGKCRRLKLIAEGYVQTEPFELLLPHNKRELFAVLERAR